MMVLVPTGIGKLDEIFGGGVEKGSSTLIYMTPGLEGAVFAQQTLIETLKAGGKGLYLVSDKAPESIIESVNRLSWKADQFKKVKFIDCFSAGMGQASSQKYFVREPWKLDKVGEALAKAASENSGAVLVMDSFSAFAEKSGEDNTLSATEKWKGMLKKEEITTFSLFTNWTSDDKAFAKISKPFDYAIKLNAVEEKMMLRNYFMVAKAPKQVARTPVPFKVGTEGVAIYIPKVLVTGPFHGGKSTFIHAVSTRAVSVDRMGTTIALDHGYIEYGGISLDLFGTPGQERFTFMIDILNRDVFGIILIVDAISPEFERAVEMLKYVEKYGIPAIVAANKQDLRGALKPEDVKRELMKRGLSTEVTVVGVSALTKKGCMDVVKALVDQIVGVKSA